MDFLGHKWLLSYRDKFISLSISPSNVYFQLLKNAWFFIMETATYFKFSFIQLCGPVQSFYFYFSKTNWHFFLWLQQDMKLLRLVRCKEEAPQIVLFSWKVISPLSWIFPLINVFEILIPTFWCLVVFFFLVGWCGFLLLFGWLFLNNWKFVSLFLREKLEILDPKDHWVPQVLR